jgi:hypothetical protein
MAVEGAGAAVGRPTGNGPGSPMHERIRATDQAARTTLPGGLPCLG